MEAYSKWGPDWGQLVKICSQPRLDISSIPNKERLPLSVQQSALASVDLQIRNLFVKRKNIVRGIIETELIPADSKRERDVKFCRTDNYLYLPHALLSYDLEQNTNCVAEKTEISVRSAARYLNKVRNCYGIQKYLDELEFFQVGGQPGVRCRGTNFVLEILGSHSSDNKLSKIQLLILVYHNYDLMINGFRVNKMTRADCAKRENDPSNLLIQVVSSCFKINTPFIPEIDMVPIQRVNSYPSLDSLAQCAKVYLDLHNQAEVGNRD